MSLTYKSLIFCPFCWSFFHISPSMFLCVSLYDSIFCLYHCFTLGFTCQGLLVLHLSCTWGDTMSMSLVLDLFSTKALRKNESPVLSFYLNENKILWQYDSLGRLYFHLQNLVKLLGVRLVVRCHKQFCARLAIYSYALLTVWNILLLCRMLHAS